MKVRATDFRVEEGQNLSLDKWQTVVEPICESKKQYQKILANHIDLSSLQQLLYASNRYAVLLIFQAMDAAGKDGAIGHVMSRVNPQGCLVIHPDPMPAGDAEGGTDERRSGSPPSRIVDCRGEPPNRSGAAAGG
jgi:polyphosphate kinase 2 (PPK2 family)